MNPAAREWVAKAEGDFATAGRELRARKDINYDAVCFHCQQCAEKYLKAVLQENNVHIPKIHYLLELLGMILKFDKSYEVIWTLWKITRSGFDTQETLQKKIRHIAHTSQRRQCANSSERNLASGDGRRDLARGEDYVSIKKVTVTSRR